MSDQELQVFISHSSKDAKLALALINLLRTALGLLATDIRCSSVDGYRLPVGRNTESELRQEVHSAKVFVALITPNSISSDFVMFELGARWGSARFLAPLCAGVDPVALSAPLNLLNALSASSAAQLHQFLEDTSKQLGLPLQNAASYSDLITSINALANQIPASLITPSSADPTANPKSQPERLLPRTVKDKARLALGVSTILAIIMAAFTVGGATVGFIVYLKPDRPAAPVVRSPDEQRLVDLNNELWLLRRGPSSNVNKHASQLVNQMLEVDDTNLSLAMQILKYEHLSYAWGMVAGSESDSNARLKAAEESLKACATARAIVSKVNRSNPSDKKMQAARDWIIKDDAEARINRISAGGLCIRSQINHDPLDARKAREIIENLPDHYLAREKPEKSSDLQPCLEISSQNSN
jgi:hypothetical protein